MSNPEEIGQMFRNRMMARKLMCYDGLRIGTGYPTDVDLFIEYHGKAFIFCEAKYGKTLMPEGQRIALERLVDACGRVKPSLLIFAQHDFEGDVDAAKMWAIRTRFNGVWTDCDIDKTVKAVVDEFIKYVDHG